MDKIVVLDFGSQYTQLIARRIRELNVYCEIHPYNNIPKIGSNVKGIILSGSPCSVRDEEAPTPDLELFDQSIPVLGICYGAQLMASQLGGEVEPSKHREYGRANLNVKDAGDILKDVDVHTQVWMSHGDTIVKQPESIEVIASTESVNIAAFRVSGKEVYGIQFHPEVVQTEYGNEIISNLIF